MRSSARISRVLQATGLTLLMAFVMSSSLALGATTGYKVVGKYQVAGDDRWDYITFEAATGRLFVAHGVKVDVLDATTGKTIGEIPDTPGVHGVAAPPGLTKGYISCGKADVVKVFDRTTLKTIGEIKTEKNPDAIVYDPVSNRVLVSNGDSASVSIIDTTTDTVVGSIAVGGKPEYLATDGKGLAYVNLETTNELVAIDIKARSIKKRIALTGCDEPASLAMDVAARRLFAGCGNRVMVVVDPDAGKVVKTLPVGEHTDATVFDPTTRLVFNSSGDGTITVIRQDGPDQYRAVETIKTLRGAKTMALDPAGQRIYLPTAENLPAFATGPPRPTEKPFPMKPFIVLVVGK